MKIFHKTEGRLLMDLGDANLNDANLSGADLRHADLGRADLSRAYLSHADLSRADLGRADLSRADLRDTDLRRANLRGANLRGANLRDAYLSGADLGGANLSHNESVLFCGVGNYTMILIKGESPRICAGCRWFTIGEARDHWAEGREEYWTVKTAKYGAQQRAVLEFLVGQYELEGEEG